MRGVRHLALAVLALALSVTSAHASAILVVDGPELTGAKGVNVGGTLYDVEFVEGTCSDLFTGCDSTSDFAFTTSDAAEAAGQALLDFVFVNGPAGNFDSQPSMTFGCSDSFACLALTPFSAAEFPFVSVRAAQNSPAFNSNTVTLLFSVTLSTADSPFRTWARFTPAEAAPVPEPASLTLLGLGLVGMAGRRWRQRKRA